jgi:hypothetical protein
MLCINERREEAGSGLLIYETLSEEKSLGGVFCLPWVTREPPRLPYLQHE